MPTQKKTLYQKIGELDQQKRALLKELKSHPTYAINYIKEACKEAIEKGTWFVRTAANGDPMPITDPIRVFRYTDIIVDRQQLELKRSTLRVTKRMTDYVQTFYRVCLTTENMNGSFSQVHIEVSMDRPMRPQLFQNMVELTPAQLKKIQKDIAKLEENRQRAKKIAELQGVIAKANAELQKLQK
jgi:hypothetical protein